MTDIFHTATPNVLLRQTEPRRVSMSSVSSVGSSMEAPTTKSNDSTTSTATEARYHRQCQNQMTIAATAPTVGWCSIKTHRIFACESRPGVKTIILIDDGGDDNGALQPEELASKRTTQPSYPPQISRGGPRHIIGTSGHSSSSTSTNNINSLWNNNQEPVRRLTTKIIETSNNGKSLDVLSSTEAFCGKNSKKRPTCAEEVEDVISCMMDRKMTLLQLPAVHHRHLLPHKVGRKQSNERSVADQGDNEKNSPLSRTNDNIQDTPRCKIRNSKCSKEQGNDNDDDEENRPSSNLNNVHNENTVLPKDVSKDDSCLCVGKRVEVQWDMEDGRKEWFAGSVASILKGGRHAFIHYDDGDKAMINNGQHPQHVGKYHFWRVSQTTCLTSKQNHARKVYNGWMLSPTTSNRQKEPVNDKTNDSGLPVSVINSLSHEPPTTPNTTNTRTCSSSQKMQTTKKKINIAATKKQNLKYKIEKSAGSTRQKRTTSVVAAPAATTKTLSSFSLSSTTSVVAGPAAATDTFSASSSSSPSLSSDADVGVTKKGIINSKNRLMSDCANVDFQHLLMDEVDKFSRDTGSSTDLKEKPETGKHAVATVKATLPRKKAETSAITRARKLRRKWKKLRTYRFCRRYPPRCPKIPPSKQPLPHSDA